MRSTAKPSKPFFAFSSAFIPKEIVFTPLTAKIRNGFDWRDLNRIGVSFAVGQSG
jgi:hypothetical protein